MRESLSAGHVAMRRRDVMKTCAPRAMALECFVGAVPGFPVTSHGLARRSTFPTLLRPCLAFAHIEYNVSQGMHNNAYMNGLGLRFGASLAT